MILMNDEFDGGGVVPPSAGGGRSGCVSRGRSWRLHSPVVDAAGARRRAGVLRISSAHPIESAAVERLRRHQRRPPDLADGAGDSLPWAIADHRDRLAP